MTSSNPHRAKALFDREFLLVSFLFLAYISFQIKPYLLYAMVWDEIWFDSIAAQKAAGLNWDNAWAFIFSQENELGYGSLYWILNTFLIKLFGTVFFSPMRFVSFVSLLLIPASFLKKGLESKSPNMIFALLLWFSMPAAWWYGKISGTELIAMACCSWGICWGVRQQYHSMREKMILFMGWMLLGVSVGLKLNFAPILFFVGASALFYKFFSKRLIVIMGMGVLAGFVLANPFVLIKPMAWMNNIKQLGPSGFVIDLGRLPTILYSNSMEWDLALSGGLFAWSLSLSGFLGYLALCFYIRVPARVIIVSGITFILTALLLMQKSSYGWYWFPFVLVFPFVILEGKKPLSLRSQLIAFVILMALSYPNVKNIVYNYSLKMEHIENLRFKQMLRWWVVDEILKLKIYYEHIVDLSELGLDLTFHPRVYKDLHTFSIKVLQPEEIGQIAPGEKVLLLLGDRMSHAPLYSWLKKDLEQKVIHQADGDLIVVYQNKNKFLNLYVLVKE